MVFLLARIEKKGKHPSPMGKMYSPMGGYARIAFHEGY
jgi:hypothetical protein